MTFTSLSMSISHCSSIVSQGCSIFHLPQFFPMCPFPLSHPFFSFSFLVLYHLSITFLDFLPHCHYLNNLFHLFSVFFALFSLSFTLSGFPSVLFSSFCHLPFTFSILFFFSPSLFAYHLSVFDSLQFPTCCCIIYKDFWLFSILRYPNILIIFPFASVKMSWSSPLLGGDMSLICLTCLCFRPALLPCCFFHSYDYLCYVLSQSFT